MYCHVHIAQATYTKPLISAMDEAEDVLGAPRDNATNEHGRRVIQMLKAPHIALNDYVAEIYAIYKALIKDQKKEFSKERETQS